MTTSKLFLNRALRKPNEEGLGKIGKWEDD